MLKNDAEKLITRSVSLPRMTSKEIQGSRDFWRMAGKDLPARCQCRYIKAASKNVLEGLRLYERKGRKIGALQFAAASVALSKCKRRR